ncbi:MAG: ATP-binding protein [Steroidobacteraceae bacterium]
MAARNSYDSLTRELVAGFVAQQEENLHLEFKLLNDPQLGNRDDRKNLARALSGFANSAGGVLVWGVEARKNERDVDCAIAAPGVRQPTVLLTRLNQLTGEALDPVLPGIEHRIIGDRDADPGFVATFVPESPSGPHMAKLGEDRYYKRSGDSFYGMEHFDIADMFAQRRKPRLELVYRVGDPGPYAKIILGLRNVGRASARAPYLWVTSTLPFRRHPYGLDGHNNDGLPFLREQAGPVFWSFGANSDFVIHPGVLHNVARLTREGNATPLPEEGIRVHYGVACDDQPLIESTLVIPRQELAP